MPNYPAHTGRAAALTLGTALLLAGVTAPACAKPTITIFDPPGSTLTVSSAINAGGAIAGTYDGNATQAGFIRAADGTYTTFLPKGAMSASVGSINNAAW